MYFELIKNENGIFIVFVNEDSAFDWFKNQKEEITDRLVPACWDGYFNAFRVVGNDSLTINDTSIIK